MSLFGPEQIQSINTRTDLLISTAQGSLVTPREGYLRVETPENPGFYWGNYLFFRNAPQAGDFARWTERFHHEFRFRPGVRHLAFAWDPTERGDTADFEKAGFHYDPAAPLTLTGAGSLLRPDRAHAAVDVRPIATDEEWEAVIRNQIACRSTGQDLAAHEAFKRRQFRAYRAMQEAGLGHWWGAFLDGRLVAECGLFVFGHVARFQNVGTDPAFRRQGLCTALLHGVCRSALERNPALTLVIVAGAGEPAEAIYASLGFTRRETQHGFYRKPFTFS